MAPFIPSAFGVSTSPAPRCLSSIRRSMDMLSGMVRISRSPLAAQIKASPSPVLPLVGSMMVVSLLIFPSAIPASIMARAMRSLMLPMGFLDSCLARIVAG